MLAISTKGRVNCLIYSRKPVIRPISPIYPFTYSTLLKTQSSHNTGYIHQRHQKPDQINADRHSASASFFSSNSCPSVLRGKSLDHKNRECSPPHARLEYPKLSSFGKRVSGALGDCPGQQENQPDAEQRNQCRPGLAKPWRCHNTMVNPYVNNIVIELEIVVLILSTSLVSWLISSPCRCHRKRKRQLLDVAEQCPANVMDDLLPDRRHKNAWENDQPIADSTLK